MARSANTPREVARVLWKQGLARWFRVRPEWTLGTPEFGPESITFSAARGDQTIRLRVEPQGASPSPLLAGPRLQVTTDGRDTPEARELARLIVAVDKKGVPMVLGHPRARRLELFIVDGCNLDCSFCCEAERVRRRRYMPWEELQSRLETAAKEGVQLIQFMGGEATLHPRFADALARARDLGMATYVITNLLSWERRDFAEAVGPLLDEIMISVHAFGDEAGALVTDRPAWWRRFQAAAVNARETLRGRVRCATVLSHHNVDDLERIGGVVEAFGAHAWVLGNPVPVLGSRIDPTTHALTLSEQRALVPRIRALSARMQRAGCQIIFFCTPHCVIGPGLWDSTHDDLVGDQDLSDDAPTDRESVTFWPKAHDLARPDAAITLGRRRGSACVDCVRRDRCGGYFAAYLDTHGESEFHPILSDSPPPAGRSGGPERARGFHLIGVGLAKTGTTSLASMFQAYRWGHEVWFEHATLAVEAWRRGDSDAGSIRDLVRWRDEATQLECDSASFNHYWIETLRDRHPKASFVLTVRAPAAWLASLFSMWLRNSARYPEGVWPEWQQVLGRLMLGDHFRLADYASTATLALAAPGLVVPGLSYWARENARILDALPSDRSLVVRTRDLNASRPALASLVGVPVETLRSAHANRGGQEVDLAAWVGPRRLEAEVARLCGAVDQRLGAIAHAPQ
jgi:MoaA/NifB/PqqE/SkfB family radical SAM enzyme